MVRSVQPECQAPNSRARDRPGSAPPRRCDTMAARMTGSGAPSRLGGSTLASTEDAGTPRRDRGAYLFLVLDCQRPLGPPARIALAELDEVIFGRSAPEQAPGLKMTSS